MNGAPNQSFAEPITLLHVQTTETVLDRVEEVLSREVGPIEVSTAAGPDEALDRIEASGVDCVVSGAALSEMDGLTFLRQVREVDPDLPFIFYRTTESDEYVKEAITIGANDVIQPAETTDRVELLATRIRTFVGQYRTRKRLQESQRRFTTLVENLPGMVYRCRDEPGWPMEFVSDGCRALTGHDPEALVDGDVDFETDLVHPEDRESVRRAVERALDERTSFQVDYRIETADGDRKWVWEQGCGVYEDGEAVAVEGFVTDVTDRRRQRQRIELLNRVLRHNLRNSMNVVTGHADHLASAVEDDALGEHAETIRSTAADVGRLSDTVGDIEAILDVEEHDRHPVDVSEAVEAVVGDVRSRYPGATVTVEAPERAGAQATGGLELALEHAVENAVVHAVQSGPTVDVAVRTVPSDDAIEVTVADDGPGIPAIELDALDDQSALTALDHGSGLGLWVMRWYAESVGGSLAFADNDPTGTVVTFRFPAADEPI